MIGAIWALALILVAIVAGGVFFAARLGGTMEQLRTSGIVVQGAVLNTSVTQGRSTSYRASYNFWMKGNEIEDSVEISETQYDSMRIGSSIPVTVLPSHPETHVFGTVDSEKVVRVRNSVWTGVIISCGFFGLALVVIVASTMLEAKVLSEYIACPAVIDSVSEKKDLRDTFRSVSYRFLNPDGTPIPVTVTLLTGVALRLCPGETCTVLVNPINKGDVRLLQTIDQVRVA